jgi:acyl carrier protein
LRQATESSIKEIMAAVMPTGPESEFLIRLRKVLAEEFEIDPEAVVPDANLYEDLDIDSIDAIDLIVRLKEITGKRIPPDKFKKVRTVGDVVIILENL